MRTVADYLWRTLVTLVLCLLCFDRQPDPDLTVLREGIQSLAGATIDLVDICKALRERIEALEKAEMQKKKIENLPNRKVENGLRLYLAESPH